jgi:hypothetical protein
MLRMFVLAIAVTLFAVPSARAEYCPTHAFGNSGNYSVLGELHGGPYGQAPFWCQIWIGSNGVITPRSCNPVMTTSAGVVTITLHGRLQVNATTCAVTGYVDASFSTAIPRRYTVQGKFSPLSDHPHFIAIGTNGSVSAPVSIMSLSVSR